MNIERIKELLVQIRDFGHSKECTSCAPVYECCCFEKDQLELVVLYCGVGSVGRTT